MGLRGDFISDGKLQRFWTEMINKEQTNRAEWLVKHKNLMDSCVNRKPRAAEIPDTAELVEKIRKLRGPPIPAPIKHTKKSFTTVYPKIDQKELDERIKNMEMKKAKPEVEKMIYNGLSHFGEGRYKYLRKRAETAPELKWNYAQTSTQEYGWRLNDTWEYKKPTHGRGRVIKDNFYRTTGVMGDSSYVGSKFTNLNAVH